MITAKEARAKMPAEKEWENNFKNIIDEISKKIEDAAENNKNHIIVKIKMNYKDELISYLHHNGYSVYSDPNKYLSNGIYSIQELKIGW